MFVGMLLALGGCVPAIAAVEPPDAVFVEVGEDRGLGSVVAVQPWLQPLDYATGERLELRLRTWLDDARGRGWLDGGPAVVLPQSTGTWLVAVDEGRSVYAADRLDDALGTIARHHLGGYALAHPTDDADARSGWRVFSLESASMADVYQTVMSDLASDYAISLVAGTIVLPDPELSSGSIAPGDGPLVDAAFVFGPDGALLGGPTGESHPDERASELVAQGSGPEIVAMPAGAVGIAIGGDGAFCEALADADVVLAPASGVSRATEQCAASVVVSVPIRGPLWDVEPSGAIAWAVPAPDGSREEGAGPDLDGPVVVRVWR